MCKYLFFIIILLISVQLSLAQNGGNLVNGLDSADVISNPNAHQSSNRFSDLSEKIDVNFLFRSSVEFPRGAQNQSAVKLNEARFEVKGDITPNLAYRIRYRLNRSTAPRSLDDASGSIDHANITYRFGNNRKWHLTAGKQAAYVGSWEFERNPTFEYQYTEYVNRQLNIFLLAMKLGYDINKNHSLHLQLHNTHNENFNTAHNAAGYNTNGLAPSKTPFGIYAAWLGKMLDGRWETFYSYNVSQFAKSKTNYAVSIGNKVVLDRFGAYLDLQSTNMAVDYTNIASPSVNKYQASSPIFVPAFAQDINYKTAVLRMDYEFVPKWFITAKGFYETASHRTNSNIGSNFRENIGYLAGLEYKPVARQEMRLFTYYYNNTSCYNNAVAGINTNQNLHLFAVGVLYFVNAL